MRSGGEGLPLPWGLSTPNVEGLLFQGGMETSPQQSLRSSEEIFMGQLIWFQTGINVCSANGMRPGSRRPNTSVWANFGLFPSL